jgi:proteasome lid subunit RPN8/RPN11
MSPPRASPLQWEDQDTPPFPPELPLEQFLADVDTSVVAAHGNGGPLLLIAEEAFEQMLADCRNDTSREHAGALLGTAWRDPSGDLYVAVDAAVLAESTVGSSVHVTFTPESWPRIWEELRVAPERRLVGWYHTHPGLGVFLSGTDLRTQALFFSHPWQVAVVMDPRRNEIGFFHGREGARVGRVLTFVARKTAAWEAPVESPAQLVLRNPTSDGGFPNLQSVMVEGDNAPAPGTLGEEPSELETKDEVPLAIASMSSIEQPGTPLDEVGISDTNGSDVGQTPEASVNATHGDSRTQTLLSRGGRSDVDEVAAQRRGASVREWILRLFRRGAP